MAFQAAVKFLVGFAFQQQRREPLGVADGEIAGKVLAQSPHQAGYPGGDNRHRRSERFRQNIGTPFHA